MATPKALSFAHDAQATATALEIAYRRAKRLSERWYALNMATDIPFDTDLLTTDTQPLTNMDIYGIINRADELIADYEASNKAKLNTILKASNAPGDWR